MEQVGEAKPNFASCVTDSVRGLGSDNPDTQLDDSVASRAAGVAVDTKNHVFPAGMARAPVPPSLVLLDSVLDMAPRHQTALRCRATTLARLGRTHEALAAAGLAVAAAKAAVRATEVKEKHAELCRTSASVASPASMVECDVTRTDSRHPFPTPAAPAGRKHSGRIQHHGKDIIANEALAAKVTGGVGGIRIGGSVGLVAGGGPGGVGDSGDGNSFGGQRRPSSSKPSIGFMRSSKVNVTVGGLLLTGGGRADTIDVLKSLILRGCLHQKMGHRKNAEEDYGQALALCNKRLHEIEGRLPSHSIEPNNDTHQTKAVASGGNGIRSGQGHRTHFGATSQEKGAAQGRQRDATRYPTNNATAEYLKDSPPPHIIDDGGPSWDQDERGKVLKLKSLIHHNFATVQLSALLGADTRVSFLKVGCELSGLKKQFSMCLQTTCSRFCPRECKHISLCLRLTPTLHRLRYHGRLQISWLAKIEPMPPLTSVREDSLSRQKTFETNTSTGGTPQFLRWLRWSRGQLTATATTPEGALAYS